MLRVSLWSGKNGSMVSHKDGLTQQNIDDLQQLKVGDRLSVWPNQYKNGEYSPDFTLKTFIANPKVEPVAVEVETAEVTSSSVAKAASE